MLHVCTCKDKRNKSAYKHENKWEEKHDKDNLGKDAKRGAKKHVKHTKRQRNMLSNKMGCPWGTNVGLDQVTIVPLNWSMDNTPTHTRTCRHVCKDAKKQRKPNGWRKTSKASISTLHGAEKGVNQKHQHHGGVSHKWLY